MAAQNTNLSPRIHQNQNLRQVNYSHRVAITQYVSLQKRQLPKIFLFYLSHKYIFTEEQIKECKQDELPTIFEKLSPFSGNF